MLALLIVGIVFAAGCIGQVSSTGQITQPVPEDQPQDQPQEQPQETETPEGNLYEPPSGSPAMTIASPADGAVLEGTSAIGVRVTVENFRLSGATKELRENEGQIHAVLDGPETGEKYTPFNTFSFSNLEPGTYTIMVELVDNQRNPIGVSDSVTVTLAG